MIAPSWLLLITVVAAALALFDGIRRLRGKRGTSILQIAEIIFATLMLLSFFFTFPAPFTTFLFALILEVVLGLLLVLPGSGRRGRPTVTIVALILNTVVVLMSAGWLNIPGLG